MSDKMNALDWVSIILLLVGGINWGLMGFFKFDLVVYLFGYLTLLTRIVYGLVGVAALYSIYSLFKIVRR